MPDSNFLGGKVWKKTLPILTPPFDPSSPTLKRLLLPQGELAQFHDSDEPIRYLAFLELLWGTVRGNHYHQAKDEFLYLIHGNLLVLIEDLDAGVKESVPMFAGELLFLPPRIAHAFQVLEAGQAIEFSSHRFDARDTCRHTLL